MQSKTCKTFLFEEENTNESQTKSKTVTSDKNM